MSTCIISLTIDIKHIFLQRASNMACQLGIELTKGILNFKLRLINLACENRRKTSGMEFAIFSECYGRSPPKDYHSNQILVKDIIFGKMVFIQFCFFSYWKSLSNFNINCSGLFFLNRVESNSFLPRST